MNVVENAADAANGALFSAATTRVGVDASGHTTERACLNCRTPLIDDYCHRCGQKGHVHRTLSSIGHDLVHGVFHFDGKIWRTLPLLAWRPGELTRRYIDGERSRFVSPLALFLFSVFLLATILGSLPGKGFLDGLADGITDTPKKVDAATNHINGQLAALQSQRQGRLLTGRSVDDLDARIAELQEEKRTLGRFGNNPVKVSVVTNTDNAVNSWIDDRWRQAKQNPQLLVYKIKNSAYKFSWLLVPMSVPFLWLLFPFSRRFRMYDHAIFAIYSLSFMSLLVIVLALLAQTAILPGVIALLALTIPPVHLYRQLRGTYALRRLSAFLRTMLLTAFAGFVLILWASVLMLLGAI